MASSLVLVVKTDHAAPSELVTADAHTCMQRLLNHLSGAAAGTHNASVDVHTSTTAPAAASGTLTITNASVAANDTVTIGGIVLTAKSSGATGAQFNIGATATDTGDNLVAAIAAHATLGKTVVGTNASGVVTVTAKEKGLLGNLVGLASSNGTGIAASGTTLSGGAGGAAGTATTLSLGL